MNRLPSSNLFLYIQAESKVILFLLTFAAVYCASSPSAFASDASLNQSLHSQHQQTLTVKYWADSMSPGLRTYLLDIVKLALIETKEEYGPYTLILQTNRFSDQRSKLETEKGKYLNMQFSTGWSGEFLHPNKVQMLHFPFFKGQLGFRRCIIRSSDEERFSKIKTEQDFFKIRFGHGADWPDSEVYRHHKLRVVDANVYDSLFPMLERGRFDCIPLSILEIDMALSIKRGEYPNLTIFKDLYIYYPFEAFLAISKSSPRLIERMDVGLKKVFEKGLVHKKFDQYFGYINQEVSLSTAKIFQYTNPTLSTETNLHYFENFDIFVKEKE